MGPAASPAAVFCVLALSPPSTQPRHPTSHRHDTNSPLPQCLNPPPELFCFPAAPAAPAPLCNWRRPALCHLVSVPPRSFPNLSACRLCSPAVHAPAAQFDSYRYVLLRSPTAHWDARMASHLCHFSVAAAGFVSVSKSVHVHSSLCKPVAAGSSEAVKQCCLGTLCGRCRQQAGHGPGVRPCADSKHAYTAAAVADLCIRCASAAQIFQRRSGTGCLRRRGRRAAAPCRYCCRAISQFNCVFSPNCGSVKAGRGIRSLFQPGKCRFLVRPSRLFNQRWRSHAGAKWRLRRKLRLFSRG